MKIIIIFIDFTDGNCSLFVGRFLSNQGIQKEVCCFTRRLYWIKYRENMQSYWKTIKDMGNVFLSYLI